MIDPIVGGSLISAGADFLGNLIGLGSQNHQNAVNQQIQREQNQFNAEQAQISRDYQTWMWNKTNEYNSPLEMLRRGLNPFLQGKGSQASNVGGSAQAQAAPMPSYQAFKPDFSSVASGIASFAQAYAATQESDRQSALMPYMINRMIGDTNWRNIGVHDSGYWNKDTGRLSAQLDQSKEQQELNNMQMSARLTQAQEAQILLSADAQQILNRYMDENQQADLFIKGQTLANLYAQGALTDAQFETEMARAVQLNVQTAGQRISNDIARSTAKDLIRATNASHRLMYNSAVVDNAYLKENKKLDYHIKYYDKEIQRKTNRSFYFDKTIGVGTRIGNMIGLGRLSVLPYRSANKGPSRP